ncbi:hypothetical protein AA313_de0206397 [Arthrobotrys entomopaga]|nr:hypothetical protein AA313_de0206397 [Arthrobotrys entomopaga]
MSVPYVPRKNDICITEIEPSGKVFFPLQKDLIDMGLRSIRRFRTFAIKLPANYREIDMALACGPGDCGIEILGIVYDTCDPPNRIGIIIDLGSVSLEKFVFSNHSNMTLQEKKILKDELIALVEKLHTKYNMIHGDIKLSNFLRCKDGSIKLCDFETSRPPDEDVKVWEEESALDTDRYRCPTRPIGRAPTMFDDWYSLAMTVWSLYTGEIPFEDVDEGDEMEEVHAERRTVDLMRVEDEEVREWIRGILRQGGALV